VCLATNLHLNLGAEENLHNLVGTKDYEQNSIFHEMVDKTC